MQLSTRLSHITRFVEEGARVADIGTDHAYIPIFLITEGNASFCVASDINKGPLENAAKHIEKHEVPNIELRLGNGLEKVTLSDEIDTITIGGMGGYLIKDILENSLEVVKGAKRLILQPQNGLKEVRQYLHSIGYAIIDESFVEDEGKYYTVICAEKGEETYSEEYEYIYGKITLEKQNEDFKRWMAHKEKVYSQIYANLEKQNTQSSKERKIELDKEYSIFKEAKKCIR